MLRDMTKPNILIIITDQQSHDQNDENQCPEESIKLAAKNQNATGNHNACH